MANKGLQGFGRPGQNFYPRNLGIGQGAFAGGNLSLAVGKNCTASNYNSVSVGNYNQDQPYKIGTGTSSGYGPTLGHVLVGSYNFGTNSGFANVSVGILNNQVGVTFQKSTCSFKGIPGPAATIGRLNTIVGTLNITSSNYGTAIGYKNTSSNIYTSAIGYNNTASGSYSFAAGFQNTAAGTHSTAAGYKNSMNSASLNCHLVGGFNFGTSVSYATVAFGLLNNQQSGTLNTTTGAITGTPAAANTVGKLCTAVGILNTTSAYRASAIGYNNIASSARSTAVGYNNTTGGSFASALGYSNTASGSYSSAVGYKNSTTGGGFTSALGYSNTASGNYSSAVGCNNSMNAASLNNHLVGGYNFGTSASFASVAFGLLNNQTGGTLNLTTGVITGTPAAGTVGYICTAVGILNTASVYQNTAVGLKNTASAGYAIAIGNLNTASGQQSVALGYDNTASGGSSVCIGNASLAQFSNSVSLGISVGSGAASAVAVGILVNNLTTNSAEFGADNTNKIHCDSLGLQFQSRFLPQILSRTTGIDGTTIAATSIYTVPTGKQFVATECIVCTTTVTGSFVTPPTASITTTGGKTCFASNAMTGMTTVNRAFSYINALAAMDVIQAADVVQLNIGTGASGGTVFTLTVDLIGYLF